MVKKILRLSSLMIFAFPICLTAKTQKNLQIDVESFFRPSRIQKVALSPDGKHVAGLAPLDKEGKVVGLIIINLETMEPLSIKGDSTMDVYDFQWVGDNAIVFNVSNFDSYVSGLYKYDLVADKTLFLVGNDAVVEVVSTMPTDPEHVRIWIKDQSVGDPRLAKLNLAGFDPKRKTALPGEDLLSFSLNQDARGVCPPTADNVLITDYDELPAGDVYYFVCDRSGQARITLRFFDKKLEYLYRKSDQDDWRRMPLDPEDWTIMDFQDDNDSLYVIGYNGEETTGLYSFDLETETFGGLLFRDNHYDFSATSRLRLHENTLIGVAYDRDKPVVKWMLPDMDTIQAMLDKNIVNRTNVIYDWSDDFNSFLVYSYSDNAPVNYYILDLAKMSLRSVSGSAPWIDANLLAKTRALHFETSDGLRLEGYLTLPNSGEAPYPMVCLVHGGPWVRDTSGYDAEVQFLANRGYAVLQVNYRGSTGYGKQISSDPYYDFLKMNEDITEAVKFTIKEGVSDPDRLAIMGGSFGGYASLCGAAFEPDLYKCAISIAGVFDWERLTIDRKRQGNRYHHQELLRELGNPKKEREVFEKISPINHVEKIKVPIFIAHGKNDKNVSVKQSRQLQKALKEQGVPYQTFYRSQEGHGFFKLKNRIELYGEIEEFLKKYL